MSRATRLFISGLLSFGLVSIAGCEFATNGDNGGGSGGSSNGDKFVGTWSCDFEETTTCGDQSRTEEGSASWTIREGPDTDLVTTGEDGCEWGMNVEGDTARVVDGATCTFEDPDGNTVNVEENSCELTLTDDTTFMEDCMFDATIETSDGTQECTLEETATCNK